MGYTCVKRRAQHVKRNIYIYSQMNAKLLEDWIDPLPPSPFEIFAKCTMCEQCLKNSVFNQRREYL